MTASMVLQHFDITSPHDVTTTSNPVVKVTSLSQISYSCRCYDFIIEAVFMGILCIFGFAGNTLSMLCLSRDRSKTATPLLLISLEVADTLFLFTVFILRVLTSVDTFALSLPWIHSIRPYLAKYIYPSALIAETGTIYLTILVTLNRYISVCWPYRARDLCSVRHARIHIAAVVAFSILFNLPRFFEYDIIHEKKEVNVDVYTVNPVMNSTVIQSDWSASNMSNYSNETAKEWRTTVNMIETSLSTNKTYRIVYSNILYFVVMFFIPLVSLLLLNQRLIRALHRTKQRRAQMLKKSKKAESFHNSEEDITQMLIVVVMVFVVTQTPAMVTQVLVSFLDVRYQVCPMAFFFYERISDFLVVANSSLNFIIYCFCSKRFCQILLQIVCRKRATFDSTRELSTEYARTVGGQNRSLHTQLVNIDVNNKPIEAKSDNEAVSAF